MHTQNSTSTVTAKFHPKKAATTGNALKAITDLFDRDTPVRHFQPGNTIVLDGTRAETVYEVVSGTIRCCTISEDGRRQIFRFVRAGDFLGLVDLDTWHYTAEAVDHVIVRSAPRSQLEMKIRFDPDLQRAVRGFIARELATRERQLASIAYMPAAGRLQNFLMEFANSRNTDGFVVLPMTRRDIGDHLGLTLETVSRAFSTLRQNGVIEMKGTDRFKVLQQEFAHAA